ncbi:hypothetical protein [Emcibacter sp.]|uniref:hypothetical protein n=1 Tax=Emcibacter sp. TaxID=1979954 RepID=UPI002AA7E403|nr:hypothetical protein [Emcibacter sp.]
MNTKFSYLYRDAANYKNFHDVIMTGIVELDQLEPFLHEGQFFIPSEVGLPDLQDTPLTYDDHIWHEISAVTPTEEKPTVNTQADIFLNHFASVSKNNWNEDSVYKKKGML